MTSIAASSLYAYEKSGLRDLWSIRRIEQACFKRDAYDIFALIQMMLQRGMYALKATFDGAMIGFVACEPDAKDDATWIVTIGVAPLHQGRGVGAALIDAAEREAKGRFMRLTVRRSNYRAIALYERKDYRFIHAIPRYYNDGEDGLMMEKPISPPR